jgi:hypothetical protein
MSEECFVGDKTHHLRNPLQPVQDLCHQPTKKLTNAEKAALLIQSRNHREVNLKLDAIIKEIHCKTNKEIEQLSKEYHQKETSICNAVYCVSELSGRTIASTLRVPIECIN